PSIQELTSPPGLLFPPATWTYRRSRPEFLIHVISLLNKYLKLHLSPESFCMWVKKLSKTMTFVNVLHVRNEDQNHIQ
ncbi:hypothetical protein ATANTOWER_028256, partial [Ataeniobius toweri]|nr:hypothetical protein [Ataeniobius toweri]